MPLLLDLVQMICLSCLDVRVFKNRRRKLHLKHHHMNLDQFKRRTAALQIPKQFCELYVQLVKICQEHGRAPSKAKISGLRSEVGDLTFADHGELPIPASQAN